GDLKGVYEVVEKDIVIKPKDLNYMITVELKRTDSELPFDPDNSTPFGYMDDLTKVGFGLDLLDENGNILYSYKPTEGGLGGPYSSEDVKSLMELGKNESATIRWKIGGGIIEDEGVPAKIRITSALKAGTGTSEVSSSTSSSNDWDKFLDEYDSYCTKLAGLSKKAMAGDLSAMTDYASMLESAESLQSKLEGAESEMTAAQVARLNKIVQKMAQAAM
ncbi:MAG: hypothetical protein K2J17_03095, partial [Paramuribaculum sp.]|nr:hypothetical protein [Paramuribaculum sp.]